MSLSHSLRPFPRPDFLVPALLGAALVLALSLAAPAGPFVALGALALVLAVADPFLGILAGIAVSLAVHMDFQVHFKIPLSGFSLYAPDAVELAILISLVLHRLAGRPIGRAVRLSLPLLAFLVYAHLRCAFAVLQGIDPHEVLADIRPFTHYGVALLVPALLTSRARLRMLLWTLLISSTAGCLYGVVHALANQGAVVYDLQLGFARLTGGSEGAYGPVTCVGLAILALSDSRRLRIFAAIQVPIAGAATLLTYSRGSWMSLVVGVVVVAIGVGLRRRKRLVSMLSTLLLGSALVVAGLELRGIPVLQSVVARSGAATVSRLDLSLIHRFIEYQTVVREFGTAPIFGLGPGTWFHYFMPAVGWVSSAYTHSSFLYILSKWGLVGLGLFLGFFLLFLWRGARAFPRASLGERAVLLLGMLAGLVSLAVKSLSAWHLNIFMLSLWVGAMLGTLDALSRPELELDEDIR